MPRADDRIRDALERAALPGTAPSDVTDRIASKRRRRRVARRAQVAALVVVVLAGTGAGTYALTQEFRFGSAQDDVRTPNQVVNGPIAFLSTRVDGPSDAPPAIYELPFGDSNPVELAGRSDRAGLAWSPDGTRLAYSKSISDARSEIVVWSPGQEVGIARGGFDPSWSPDGTRIVYATDQGGLAIVAASGDDVGTPIASFERPSPDCLDALPAWSPDGRRIAFTRECPVDIAIYVMNVDGSQPTRLSCDNCHGATQPQWSPDGTKIAYVGLVGASLSCHGCQTVPAAIFVMDADGDHVHRVTDTSDHSEPSWSPDGAWIAYTSGRPGDRDIHAVTPDGATARNVISTPADEYSPAWQPWPDGRPPAMVAASEMPQPTPSMSPQPTPSMSPLPAACDGSRAFGDFDGDGQLDAATISRPDCLVPPEDRVANDPLDSAPYAIEVRSPADGFGAGIWPMPECRDACRAVAAPDMDGNGVAELLVSVAVDAQDVEQLEIYALPASEAGPVVMTSTGARGDPGEPARFNRGGTETERWTITCATGSSGERFIVSTHAERSTDGSMWHEQRSWFTFAFDYATSGVIGGGVRSSPALALDHADELDVASGDPAAQEFFDDSQICGAPVSG